MAACQLGFLDFRHPSLPASVPLTQERPPVGRFRRTRFAVQDDREPRGPVRRQDTIVMREVGRSASESLAGLLRVWAAFQECLEVQRGDFRPNLGLNY